MYKLALTAGVFACAGCAVSVGSNRVEELRRGCDATAERRACDLAASRADEAAGRTGVTAAATITYWLGVKAALHPRPIDPAEAARAVDHLPTLGVDPDLVREGRLVAEKMRAAATAIGSIPAVELLVPIYRPGVAKAEGLSREAVVQCRAVERLRPELTARYGVEFPPLDLPTP